MITRKTNATSREKAFDLSNRSAIVAHMSGVFAGSISDSAVATSRELLPNQALEPTTTAVTIPAGAGLAPAVAVAHLKR
jgi:hypothetical protein